MCLCSAVMESANLWDTASQEHSLWSQQLVALGNLPKRQLRGRALWEGLVQQELLPYAEAQAAEVAGEQEVEAAVLLRAVEEEGGRDSQRWVATRTELALQCRACAHLGCTSLRGASEARQRGRRCGGCRAVRYCSPECAAADWSKHAQVCCLRARTVRAA